MPEFTGTRDLRTYVRILWRWKFLFLFFVVAAPLAAYLIASAQPKVYRSTTLVNPAASVTIPGGSSAPNNVTAVAEVATTTPVADIAAGLLHPPANPSEIVGEVSAAGDQATGFVKISAEDRNPKRAAAIANAFAQALGVNQHATTITSIRSQIKGVRAQLGHLGPNATSRSELQSELNQLRAQRAAQQGNDSGILQAATPSGTPVGNPRRAAEIGLVIGLLLAFGAVALAESADRRIRTPGDLEGMTDLPLLASIAPSAFSDKLEASKEDYEAFDILRTALMYFNLDRRLESVIITSPGEKDGKTTVATGLALAAARAGLHVILLDADLRRTQVGPRLGVRNDFGLGAVLAGQHPLSEALVESPLDEPGSGRLEILPAGPPPPNPAACTSSQEIQRVLRECESQSDLVVVDTPAALAVGDSLPLMRLVSGVVLVARMNRSSRQTIQRLQKIINAAHGAPLGVVATGVRAGPGYEHYAAKYYYTRNGTNGHRSHSPFRRRAKQKGGYEVQPASVADAVARDAGDREQRRRARQKGSYDVGPASAAGAAAQDVGDREQRRRARQKGGYEVQPASAADAAAQDVGDREQRRPKAEGHNPSDNPAPRE